MKEKRTSFQRTPLQQRYEAYDQNQKMVAEGKLTRREIVFAITRQFPIKWPIVYGWFHGRSPLGKAGKVTACKELFYVLGALLGDGCIYHWRGNFQVWLLREKEFVEKYASKLSMCITRPVKFYPDKRRNFWFAKIGNAELYFPIKRIRNNFGLTLELIRERNFKINALEFIEGFFDADACVKVIRDKNTTPRICLDFSNTNYELLKLVKDLLKLILDVDADFSIQRDKRPNRKTGWHLRIYGRENVEKFLRVIPTMKLKPEKIPIVGAWLRHNTLFRV